MKVYIIGVFLGVLLVFVVQVQYNRNQELYSIEVSNLEKEAQDLNKEFKKLQELIPVGKVFTYLNTEMICIEHITSSARTSSAWGTSHNYVQEPYIRVQYKTQDGDFTNEMFYIKDYDLLKTILE